MLGVWGSAAVVDFWSKSLDDPLVPDSDHRLHRQGVGTLCIDMVNVNELKVALKQLSLSVSCPTVTHASLEKETFRERCFNVCF